MPGLLELYEGFLNKPKCESIGDMRIGRNGKGYRKLRTEDIPIEWLHYAKKHGIKIRNKTLLIGEELDPVDTECVPLLNLFYPQTSSEKWCCTPSIAQYTNNGAQSPTQTCFYPWIINSVPYVIFIEYFGISLIDENGSLDLLMDSTSTISSATPNWTNPSVNKPTILCGTTQNNGAVYLSFAAMPTKQFNISTAQFLIGTNSLTNGGIFDTVIEWQDINYQPQVNVPLTINIYLGVS